MLRGRRATTSSTEAPGTDMCRGGPGLVPRGRLGDTATRVRSRVLAAYPAAALLRPVDQDDVSLQVLAPKGPNCRLSVDASGRSRSTQNSSSSASDRSPIRSPGDRRSASPISYPVAPGAPRRPRPRRGRRPSTTRAQSPGISVGTMLAPSIFDMRREGRQGSTSDVAYSVATVVTARGKRRKWSAGPMVGGGRSPDMWGGGSMFEAFSSRGGLSTPIATFRAASTTRPRRASRPSQSRRSRSAIRRPWR